MLSQRCEKKHALEWILLYVNSFLCVGREVKAPPACLIDVDAADLIQDLPTVFQCHRHSALCCRMSRLVTCAGAVDGVLSDLTQFVSCALSYEPRDHT